jgi:hypothetical protein
MSWECFMVKTTGQEMRWLRRHAVGSCPGPYRTWHNAQVRIEDGPATWSDAIITGTDAHYHSEPDVRAFLNDPRWPTKCAYCDYVFAEDDKPKFGDRSTWGVWAELIYRAVDGRGEWPQRSLPPGAMFDAVWHRPFGHIGPDGLSLTVQLPPGGLDLWCIDSHGTDGGKWTRTGVPPLVTVKPSIKTGAYHGFLQNGRLTDCLGDRVKELAKATKALAEL